MTKKHYEIIADSIQKQINEIVESDDSHDLKYYKLKMLHNIQSELGHKFKLDNNNFSFIIWNSYIDNPYLYYKKQSHIL